MQKACVICGSKSGKELDKFDLCGLHEEKGLHVLAPTVRECPMVYECQVVHSSDILPEKLSDEILRGAYINGDFHRIYFGKILSARAAGNAAELI
jgi:flavin reductase (DIM6/NTAB) family NADH-FMN oxidoreductase RutF